MQYADSIDEYVKIMLDGNNGGYANDWLLGDRKTGEIARFELGLKHTKVWRTKDGYYAGSNFPSDPDLIRDETTFDPTDRASGPNARKIRWDQLLIGNKGKIDTSLAKCFWRTTTTRSQRKIGANHRTLCGHGDMMTDAMPSSGSSLTSRLARCRRKVMDSDMAQAMSFIARIGHPCGIKFDAAKFLNDSSRIFVAVAGTARHGRRTLDPIPDRRTRRAARTVILDRPRYFPLSTRRLLVTEKTPGTVFARIPATSLSASLATDPSRVTCPLFDDDVNRHLKHRRPH